MVTMKNVSFAYGRKGRLFDGLDWQLEPGTIYGLLGRNGAGKTTLLKLLCGTLFRHDGEIRVLESDPELRRPALQQEMLFISEELPTPPMSVAAYERLYSPLYPRFDEREFTRYLAEFEVDRNTDLGKMSFGQRKKALLAFGLAANTRALILDEPTNALDIPSKGQLRRILAGASTEERTIVVSTHQVRDLEQLIDPVIILEQGNIIFQHSVDEITSALRVEVGPEEPQDAIYSERTMGGYASLVPNHSGADSRIDIELLFNAVTTSPESVNRLFTTQEVV
jgi:ABC-2 type transport system ATP-binding protein